MSRIRDIVSLSVMEPTDGWCWMRRTFVLAAALNWAPRAGHVSELYSDAGVSITSGLVPLGTWVVFSPAMAMGIYVGLWVGLGLLWSGWRPRLAAGLVLLTSCLLVFSEGANFKAYDRLLLLQAVALSVSPTRAHDLPAARYCLMIVYAGLYGQTGWGKLLEDPGWWDGSTLSYHLAHLEFGRKPLGLWISTVPTLVTLAGAATVLFEVMFPVLLFVRRAQPWLLAAGLLFHLGTVLMMDVGSFWLVAPAAYPVLMHPSHVLRVQAWLSGWPRGARVVRWVLGR